MGILKKIKTKEKEVLNSLKQTEQCVAEITQCCDRHSTYSFISSPFKLETREGKKYSLDDEQQIRTASTLELNIFWEILRSSCKTEKEMITGNITLHASAAGLSVLLLTTEDTSAWHKYICKSILLNYSKHLNSEWGYWEAKCKKNWHYSVSAAVKL